MEDGLIVEAIMSEFLNVFCRLALRADGKVIVSQAPQE